MGLSLSHYSNKNEFEGAWEEIHPRQTGKELGIYLSTHWFDLGCLSQKAQAQR